MSAKLSIKRYIPLLGSLLVMGMLMTMPILEPGKNAIANDLNNQNRNITNDIGKLGGSGGSNGFGGVYDVNLIHRYENASVSRITQNNATMEVPKPICDSVEANITTGAVQFNNYTLVGENDSESGSKNIPYKEIYVASFSSSSDSIISNISILLFENIFSESNFVIFRLYNSTVNKIPDAILLQSAYILINSKKIYSIQTNMQIRSDMTIDNIFFIGIFGAYSETNCNWSYTSDSADGDDESTAYKWNGTNWDLLPVDFHFNVTLSPINPNPTPAQAGLTINGDPVGDTGVWTYSGSRNASDPIINFEFGCNWYNWSVNIDSAICEFAVKTELQGDFSIAGSGTQVLWQISGWITSFNESYTGPGITRILEWIIPNSWYPYQCENSSGYCSFTTEPFGAMTKVQVMHASNDYWTLRSSSPNILSSAVIQIGANVVPSVKYSDTAVINVSSAIGLTGQVNIEIRNASNALKYSELCPATGRYATSSSIAIRDILDLDYGTYTISAQFGNNSQAGYVESTFLYRIDVDILMNPANGTQLMPNPFTLGMTFIDKATGSPVVGWDVQRYLSEYWGWETKTTNGSGSVQFPLSPHRYEPGWDSYEFQLKKPGTGEVMTIINYSFEIIELYPLFYQEGKCYLSVESITFNLLSLKEGYHLGDYYLPLSHNQSWMQITIRFTDVRPGFFTKDDYLQFDFSYFIGSPNDPRMYQGIASFRAYLEDILPSTALKWNDPYYLEAGAPFSATFLYHFSPEQYKEQGYYLTLASGVYTMNWYYAINTQYILVRENIRFFTYQIDKATLYGWGWVQAHLELVMLIGAPCLVLSIALAYHPISRRIIRKQLNAEERLLKEWVSKGLSPQIEAYLSEEVIEPARKKLEKHSKRVAQEPQPPSIEDQLMEATHPRERRRFYIEGTFNAKEIKHRGLLTGFMLWVIAVSAINVLCYYYLNTILLIPSAEPFVNAILLLVVYGIMFMFCVRLGMYLALPPKISVRKFSEKILLAREQYISDNIDKPDIFPASVVLKSQEFAEEIVFSEETLAKIEKWIRILYKIASSPLMLIVAGGLALIGIIFGLANNYWSGLIYSMTNILVFLTAFGILRKSVFPDIKEGEYNDMGIGSILFGIIQMRLFFLGAPTLIMGILILVHEGMKINNDYTKDAKHRVYDSDRIEMEIVEQVFNSITQYLASATLLVFTLGLAGYANIMWFMHATTFQKILHTVMLCGGLVNLVYIKLIFIPTITSRLFGRLKRSFFITSLVIAGIGMVYGGIIVFLMTLVIGIYNIVDKLNSIDDDEMIENLQDFKERVRKKVQDVKERVKKGLSNVKKRIQDMHIKERVDSKLSQVKERIQDMHIKERVGSGLSKAKEAIGSGISKIKERVGSGLSKAKEAIGSGLSKAKEAIGSGWSAVKEKFRRD